MRRLAILLCLLAAPLQGAWDALERVNYQRACRGLPPFAYDPQLAAAAASCADFRAQHGIQGHTINDFQALPPGATAQASGCAAWEPGMGFGSCCLYENYRFAGAAWTMGRDGRIYCHLFVR